MYNLDKWYLIPIAAVAMIIFMIIYWKFSAKKSGSKTTDN